jgi:hypothetical protein
MSEVFFVDGSRKFVASADFKNLAPSQSLSDSPYPSFDTGFKIAGQLTPRPYKPGRISVGDAYVDTGLTIVVGPPSGGKSYFVENRIDKSFLKLKWGEPDSGFENQDFGVLLNHINSIILSDAPGGVIDSIMPLIISSDENLGQGGLSKRILTYIRQLSAVAERFSKHIVLVANPLESGPFVSLWAEYFKAVAHSVIVVADQKVAISSRLGDKFARVPAKRMFAVEDGFSMQLGSSFPSSFALAMDSLGAVPKKSAATKSPSDVVNGSAVNVEREFGKFPELKGRSRNASDFKSTI